MLRLKNLELYLFIVLCVLFTSLFVSFQRKLISSDIVRYVADFSKLLDFAAPHFLVLPPFHFQLDCVSSFLSFRKILTNFCQ